MVGVPEGDGSVPESWISQERHRLPPKSVRAYLFAVLCVAVATLARLAFGLLGATLQFATYYPMILVCALVAGYQAGVAAIALTMIVAWLAWTPTGIALDPFSFSEWINFILFLFCALPIVWVAHKYRIAVDHLRADVRERQFLMRELEHRGKNTFAVVESIVRQSLADQSERADLIAGRIHSVSSTNDIINRSTSHTSAILKDILLNEFQPYDLARMQLIGTDVELSADVARNVALVIHELVTNAAKYGALSSAQGRVRVRWMTDGDYVALDWEETGGPEVQQPSQYGFGSRLVVRTLKALSGNIAVSLEREGLKCQINFLRQLPA